MDNCMRVPMNSAFHLAEINLRALREIRIKVCCEELMIRVQGVERDCRQPFHIVYLL